MSSLPEEIHLQILLRLPVKSTFVCKCVCKSWLSLISEPNFPKMHLDLISDRNISSNFMVAGPKYINSMSYDSIESSGWENSEFTELYYPFTDLHYGVEIVGSSNGLVCLMFYKYERNGPNGFSFDSTKFFFCLWNPTTSEYKKITKPTDDNDFDSISIYAFGYDQKNDGYKLVIGVNSSDETYTEVYVYTLESDSWKSPITVPYEFTSRWRSGVLVNGDFHFLADKGEGSLIVSMDIKEERFNEIELSLELKLSGHWFITEAVVEGCLSVLTVFRDFGPDADKHYPPRVEVWVMQDYGVPQSWTKRYTITHEVITRKCTSCSFSLKFLGTSKDGELLLMMLRNLILFNPKDGSAVERVTGVISETNYFESLVSVNTGTYASEGLLEESIDPVEA